MQNRGSLSCDQKTSAGALVFYSSFKFSNIILTAAMTKAEKVQFFPWMAASTFSMTSFGKRMVLLVVGGIEGILNFLMHQLCYKVSSLIIEHKKAVVCIANALLTAGEKAVILKAIFCEIESRAE